MWWWPFRSSPEDWELIDKTILPSAYEQSKAKATEFDVFWSEDPLGHYRKAVVLTFKCKLTGRIKVVKESNP